MFDFNLRAIITNNIIHGESNMKLIRNCLFIILISLSFNLYSSDYENNIRSLLNVSKKIFVENKLCSSLQNCTGENLIHFTRVSDGVVLYLYSIRDDEIIFSIIKEALKMYIYEQKKMNIKIYFYIENFSEIKGLNRLFKKSYITIDLKRVK